jgi:PAS domain-containing protein
VRLALPPNPVLLRMAIVLFAGTFAFLIGVIFVRALRKKISEEADLTGQTSATSDALPMHLYNTVIQQLKQQKHELHVQSKAEQQKARITETFSQAVLSNLSSGVLVFGPNGLVKSANPAAKQILGFASTTGMSAKDIFRGAVVNSNPGVEPSDAVLLSDEVEAVLREGSGRRQRDAEYATPAGAKRFVGITVSPVLAEDGALLGVACLINDLSEGERVRREKELHAELSAEKALHLRSSLATISGCAQQLARSRDVDLARQLASDIAHEAEQLDRAIGGFLREGQTAAAGAGSD